MWGKTVAHKGKVFSLNFARLCVEPLTLSLFIFFLIAGIWQGDRCRLQTPRPEAEFTARRAARGGK